MKLTITISVLAFVGSCAALSGDNSRSTDKVSESLAQLRSKYSDLNPVVQEKRRQLEASHTSSDIKLKHAESELLRLKQRYTGVHPLVQEKLKEINQLRTTKKLGRFSASNVRQKASELDALLSHYTELNPIVQQKRAEITEANQRLDGQ